MNMNVEKTKITMQMGYMGQIDNRREKKKRTRG